MTGDEVGGYQRDHATTFGVGTLKACDHAATSTFDGLDWHIKPERLSRNYGPAAMCAQPGDRAGTIRCIGCGNKVER